MVPTGAPMGTKPGRNVTKNTPIFGLSRLDNTPLRYARCIGIAGASVGAAGTAPCERRLAAPSQIRYSPPATRTTL